MTTPGDPVVAQPPAEGVPWDQFGFSLNGVRTERMYVFERSTITCPTTTDGIPKRNTPNPLRYVAKCMKDENWQPGMIVPHEALQIEPASTVLNYGMHFSRGFHHARICAA